MIDKGYVGGRKKDPAMKGGQMNCCQVGATGFEPATTCTPCKCATGLRYAPNIKATNTSTKISFSGSYKSLCIMAMQSNSKISISNNLTTTLILAQLFC